MILRIAVILVLICGCGDVSGPEGGSTAYRTYMRELVQDISDYARGMSPGFIVIPQNGQELLTEDGEPDGTPSASYILAIDGQGREDLYFGYEADDVPTPPVETDWMESFLDLAEQEGVEVLVTDYCYTPDYVDSSYARSEARGYISFAADHRELDDIPAYPAQPWNFNTETVSSLSQARNFLYLIDDGQFSSADQLVDAVSATGYDLLILDLFCCGEQLSPAYLDQLKQKPSGGERLLICYVSIGEAEDYRWYWDPEWETDPPGWLGPENPEWPGNYLVEYWDPGWRSIVFGSDSSYVDMVIGAGFDGVYLDKIDSFESFE
ncbi:MAG: endo alpha-1,4 polygalactosaminidase [Candidatus Fermentibacteraceae bacterium]|nr:endo alpha-1,4 polygalactosaminidase [Candidatus Fermentibacteraceae bacterium]